MDSTAVSIVKPQEVRRLCQRYGGPLWPIILAQCWCESRFNEDAHGINGGMGISQFAPATWIERAGDAADPYDPEVCIQTHAAYLAWLVRYWRGDKRKAIASYNHGIRNVEQWIDIKDLDWERALPAPVQAYLLTVCDLAEYIQQHEPVITPLDNATNSA